MVQGTLASFFLQVLKLAHALVASATPEAQDTGAKLYELLFQECAGMTDEPLFRQV
jgi:hypothetical protein